MDLGPSYALCVGTILSQEIKQRASNETNLRIRTIREEKLVNKWGTKNAGKVWVKQKQGQRNQVEDMMLILPCRPDRQNPAWTPSLGSR